ncbi:hypothetical protein VTK26DRAFT_6857 [Humicola hyalothermophila]
MKKPGPDGFSRPKGLFIFGSIRLCVCSLLLTDRRYRREIAAQVRWRHVQYWTRCVSLVFRGPRGLLCFRSRSPSGKGENKKSTRYEIPRSQNAYIRNKFLCDA